MDFKKKILIGIVIVIVLIVVVILALLMTFKNRPEETVNQNEEETITFEDIKDKDISNEDKLQNDEVYNVRSCIYNYLSAINRSNARYLNIEGEDGQRRNLSEEEISEYVIPLLSEKYINDNQINGENVFNYVDDIDTNVIYNIVGMKKHVGNNSYQYLISGILQDINNNFVKNAYYIVYMDYTNGKFAIEPILENIDRIQEIELEDLTVSGNEYNSIPDSAVIMDDQNIIKDKLTNFKRLMLVRPDVAFQYLDEDYRNKKFDGNVNNFIDYINSKRDEIETARLEKYQIEDYEDYTQYFAVDQNDNNYIFNETQALEYTVLLDTYTVPLPSFIEEYNDMDLGEKIAVSVQRFFEAINNKDYKYAYSKINETFRNNNFEAEADFENYANSYFYNTSIDMDTYQEEQEGIYTCNVSITTENEEGKSNTIEKQFVIKLLENADFELSFEV